MGMLAVKPCIGLRRTLDRRKLSIWLNRYKDVIMDLTKRLEKRKENVLCPNIMRVKALVRLR